MDTTIYTKNTKKMETLKYAQDLINTSNSFVRAGFNQFISGEPTPRHQDYGEKSQWSAELQGYEYAEKMAKENGIFFKHKFDCLCGGHTFTYGGFFYCDTCGKKNADEDWWTIKVEKDANEYCCHGLDFTNIQESENYAFGSTFELAIENYYKRMRLSTLK